MKRKMITDRQRFWIWAASYELFDDVPARLRRAWGRVYIEADETMDDPWHVLALANQLCMERAGL